MNKFLYSLVSNNLDGIQLISKIIAMDIRNQLEDFHVEHLTDEQMKVLNPLIRNSVFNSLLALSHYPHPSFKNRIDFNLLSIPPYWEEPQMVGEFRDALTILNDCPVVFQSAFLNGEFKLGNIYLHANRRCVKLLGSFEFRGIPYEDRIKHRAKIVRILHKEGYRYNVVFDGYEKVFLSN